MISISTVAVVTAQHDLELLKSASSSTAVIGDQITFSLVVNNDRATTVTNVEVTDLLPAGVTYVAHLPVDETYDPVTGIWDLDTILNTTTSRTLNIVVDVIADGVIFNTAEITAMDGTDYDSAPNNGVVWEDDFASACVSVLMEMECGSSATLTAESGYAGYQWYKNGSILVGDTNQVLIVSETGSYSYTTDDITSGCTVGLCCPVLVEFGSDLLPPPVVSPPGTHEICEGESLALSALDGSTNLPYSVPVNYQWYKNFVAIPGPAGTQSIYVADVAGIYHVEVTDSSGCSNVSNYVDLIVNPLPEVDVVELPEDECLGETFSFSVVDNPDYSISWELREYSGVVQTATQPFLGAGPHNFAFTDELNDNYQLEITVTDNNTGCTWSNIFSGSILSVPEITLGSPFTLCEGTCGTLTLSTTDASPLPPIESITWSGAPLNIAPDSLSAEVCPPSTPTGSVYTYSVVVNFSNGCSKAASVEVELLPSMEVNAGEDQIVCEDSEAILTASNISGATYSWTQVSGPSIATIESPGSFQTNVTDLAAGEYIFEIAVSVTGDNGTCTDTDQVKVTAIANPIVTIVPEEPDVCFDESITLAASLDPSTPTPATFFWSSTDDPGLNFLNCNPCETPTLNIPPGYSGNTITYSVIAVVTGDNGVTCTGTDEITININPAQTLTISPAFTICDGSCAPLSVSSDKTIASVLWTGGPLNNPNSANTLACPPGASQGVVTYQYTASVTDIDGCVAEASTSINVTPTIEVYAGEDQTVCEGDIAELTASTNLNSSSVNGLVEVSWSEGASNPNSGANLATTTGYMVQTNTLAPGTYEFIATVSQTSPDGISNCTDTDIVQVTVTENPLVNINASASGICAGGNQPVLLTAELANMTPGAASYFWSSTDDPALTYLSCGACETTVLSVPSNYTGNTITYTVTAYVTAGNNLECTGTANITINVNAPPQLSITQPGFICDGACAELNIAANNPIQSVLWNSGGGPINDPTALNPIVCPAGSSQGETVYTYSVAVTDVNGCVSNAATTITVTPSISVYAGEDQTVCEERIVDLEASTNLSSGPNNGFIEISWTESPTNPNTGSNLAATTGAMVQTNPLQEGEYEFIATVTQFSPNGTPECSDQDVVQITVADNPMAIIISSEPDICQDGQESVTLAATLSPTSTAPATFYWSSADDPALEFLSCSVCEAPNLTIPAGYPFPTITYTVTAVVTTDNNMECTTTTDITLDVLPSLILDPIGDVTVCDEYNPITEQRSTNLRELISGSPVDIESWSITPMIGITNVVVNGSEITFDVTPSNTVVQHEVTLTSIDGCFASTRFFAYENPRPEVSFRIDDYTCLGTVTSVWFTGNAGPAASYFWDFAGATVLYSDDANPYDGIPEGPGPHDIVWNAYPPFGNTYEVSLEVEDGGCIESSIEDITIERGFEVVWDVQAATACNTNDGIISLVSATEHLSGNDVSSDLVLTWTGPNGFNLQGSCATACNLTGLEPGTYYVRVDDSEGCFYNYTLDVQAPNNLGLNALVGYNVNCGLANGAIHVELVDGTAPYIYSFYDENNSLVASETSPDAFYTQDGLPAGNYTIIASDANNCQASGSIMLDAIEGPEIVVDNTVATDCGLSEGEITFTAIGSAPFNYELYGNTPYPGGTIAGSGTPTTLEFLPAGNYVLKVVDAGGCSSIIDFTIEGIDPNFNIDVTVIDGTCPFGPNGAPMPPVGEFIVNQPLGAYSYTWTDEEGTVFNPADPLHPTGLENGCYSLIVSDGTCTDTISLTLNPADGPVITPLFSADASCPDANNGIVSFLASGNGPLQYNIHNVSSQDGLVMSGTAINGVPIDLFTLAEGTYRLVVRDRYNCEAFYKFEIGDPSPFTIHVDQDPGTCGAQDGQACITIFGASGTLYDVQISPAVMSPGTWDEGVEGCVFGLGAVSDYYVTVTDLNDCIATFDLTGNPELLVDITVEDPVACYNPNSGSILVTVTNPNITDEVITIFDEGYNNVTAQANGQLPEGIYYIDIIAAGGACTFLDTVELVKEDCFDLALRKTSNENMVLPGQETEFTISVFNQGEIPAYDILISDYLPTGLSLSPSDVNGWMVQPGNVYSNEIPEILPGDSVSISLLAIVDNNPPFGPAINISEISYATRVDGSGIPSDDFDSTPDTDPDNDTGGTPGDPDEDDVIDDDGTFDEDDADPAQIEIVEPGAIGDWVWNDINQNGKQDLGEPGIGGVDVTLFDAFTHLPIAFTTTDITGYYEFTGLYPMAYFVVFDHGTAPNNFLPTMQDAQANAMDAMDSDADPVSGQSQTINLGAGEFNNTIDAGYYELEYGFIEGITWIDCDRNGLREPDEDLLADVQVMLIGTTFDGDPVNETTFTDSTGYYVFDPVVEGAYSVKFGYPATIGGLQITDQDAGNDAIDSDADPGTGVTLPFNILPGDTLAYDAGYQDVEGPVITPKDPVLTGVSNGDTLTFECDEAPVLDENLVMVMDNVDPNPEVTFIERFVGRGNCIQTGFIMLMECGWVATDECGNESRWMVFVKIVDTEPPILSGVPADTMVNCENIPSPPLVTATDICDNAVDINMTETTSYNGCPYTITRLWTATDDCGNFSTAEQVITVSDEVAPMISSIPPDTTVNCGEVPAFDPDRVVAFDNCDLDLTITVSDSLDDSNCPYTLHRTITVEDNCGNQDTRTRIITIVDDMLPEFTFIPADTSLECTEATPPLPDAIATDACDNNLVMTSQIDTIPGGCPQETIYYYTWTATDDCGNQAVANASVVIIDSTAPEFANVLSDVAIDCTEPLPDGLPGVTDNCDMMPQVSVQIDTLSVVDCETTILRTFTASDACGNESNTAQTVVVSDNFAPIIILLDSTLIGYGDGDTIDINCDNVPEYDTSAIKAIDNCDPNVEVTFEDLASTQGDCLADGYLFLMYCRWTAVDDCGNTSTFTIYLKVIDDEAPELTGVPATLDLSCEGDIPEPAVVGVEDNCDPDVTVNFEEIVQGDDCGAGIQILRIWSATDHCGNSTSASQIINVVDNEPPVITGVPADMLINCNDSIPLSPVVNAMDNCDEMVDVTYEEIDLGGDCATTGRNIRREWTATDNCGNQATASQMITILDTIPPVLVNVPDDLFLDCPDNVPPPPNVVVRDNCGQPITLDFMEETLGNNCMTGIQITRTWTGTDACGNINIQTQIITIRDDIAPVLSGVPDNVTLSCNDPIPGIANVTATDNCDPNVLVQFSEEDLGGNCRTGRAFRRTWTATDTCGNQVEGSQLITILPDEAPQLVRVPADTIIDCLTDLPTPPNVTAVDDCSTNLNVLFEEETIGGDCANGYQIQRTWSVEDDCGNLASAIQIINVRPDEPPVLMGVPADTIIDCIDQVPSPAIVSVFDLCSPGLQVAYTETNLGGTCLTGIELLRTWSATDDCGNTVSASQTISIRADEPPVLLGVPPHTTVTCIDDIPAPPVVTASDLCSPVVNVRFSENDLGGDCAIGRLIERVWSATDDCGNTTSASQLITIAGDEPPILNGVPSDTIINCADDIPTPPVVTAFDVCSPQIAVSFEELDLGGDCATGRQIERTWSATDDCGNTTSATQLITVLGDEPPLLSGVPASVTVGCADDVPPPANVSATDECSPVVDVIYQQDDLGGDCATGRELLRTWTAIDDCGNRTTATQLITIAVDEPPVLNGVPNNLTVSCDSDLPPPALVTATDICSPNITVVFDEVDLGGDCLTGRQIERIWSATDDCGNTTTATQLITILPDEAPVLSGVPADITISCPDDMPNPANVTASDLCTPGIQVVFTEFDFGGDCASGRQIERIWSATDACGNTTTAAQLITIDPDEPPVLVGVPSDITLACSDVVPAPPFVTADDLCTPGIQVIFTEVNLGGDCQNGDLIERSWSATDDCGNTTIATQLITIQGDDLPPELLGVPADTTIACSDSIPAPPVVTATDLCSPNVQVTFAEDDLGGNCATGREILRVWSATDDCGNTVSATQIITIIDNVPPVLSGVPDDVILNCEEDLPPPANVFATDNCPAPVDITYLQEDLGGDCMTGHDYLRTWTATDACGNQSTETQLLTIIDSTPPNILVSFTYRNVECGMPINIPTPITNDNCDGPIDLSFSDRTIDGACPQEYTFIRTFTATDACGNETTRNVTVEVSDNTAPNLDSIPSDTTIYLGQGQSVPQPPNVTAGDNCDMSVPVRLAETRLTTGCDYTLLRTWTATDDCGNMVSATQLITVIGETLTLSFNATNPGCALNDGAITVNIQGGTQPYGYLWSNGATTQTITGLVEGTYSVTINDNNGCSAVGEVTLVSQAYDLTLSLSSTPSDCDVATGTATVTASGGTSPYNFLWNTGDTSSTIMNLPAGIYSVTATDANGCSGIDSIEVTQLYADFNFLVFPTSEFCNQMDGTASVQASGGVAPYTYNWSNGAVGPYITGLSAGVYMVTATDDIGCSDTTSVLIENECPCTTPALEKLSLLPAGCPDDNGEATIELVGDEADFTYTWMPDVGIPNANNNMRTGLPSGDYTVLVRHLGNPNCELPVDFTIEYDCNPSACDTIFVLEQLFVPSQSGTESVCLPTSGELDLFDVRLDGMLLTQPFDSCYNDTIIYYSYALLANGGQMGPYNVDIWNGNGMNLVNVVVNNMQDLADSMNVVDPAGNWINDYGNKTLTGGDPQGTYGDLVITYNMNTLTMPVNTNIVPVGDAITISGYGDHLVVATDPNNGCADTVIVTITNSGLPPDFINEEFEIMQANCEEGEPVYCVKDIGWSEMDDFALTVNGYPYDRFTGSCNYDFNHAYSYFTVPGLAQNGPYHVDSWMVAGDTHEGDFDNPQSLVDWMNQTDPDGNWQLDATSFSITSEGNLHDYYGNLHITQVASGSMANQEVNTNFIPRELGVSLKPGLNELIFERLADGVTDTIVVGVACISPEYLQDRIKLGKMDTICLNTDQLLGEVVSIDNVCIDGMGAASFDIISGTNCFTCTGLSLGEADACLVICDEYGICDTTFFDVLVVPDVKTRAITDTARTSVRNMVVVNPAGNDIYNGTVSDIFVKDPPRYGTIHVNRDMTISYMPYEEWCNSNEPDKFRYELCTTEGGCDEGMVYIFVECGKIVVYNGFSPNGDGINETLRIDGLNEFPNHKLTVFNRWGIKVFEAKHYQNDWDGTWKGEPLPDGTYFFVIDNGEGNISNGYLQINR